MRKILFDIWLVVVSTVSVSYITDFVYVHWTSKRVEVRVLEAVPALPPSSLKWSEV